MPISSPVRQPAMSARTEQQAAVPNNETAPKLSERLLNSQAIVPTVARIVSAALVSQPACSVIHLVAPCRTWHTRTHTSYLTSHSYAYPTMLP